MMWRSRALSRLAGAGVSKFHSAPKAPIPYQVRRRYHLPPFSSISKTLFPQNPRFFSQDSADPTPDAGPKPADPITVAGAKPPSLYEFIMKEIGDLSDLDTDPESDDVESSGNSIKLSEKELEEGEIPEGVDLEVLERVRARLSGKGGSTSKSVESQLNEADHDTDQLCDGIEKY